MLSPNTPAAPIALLLLALAACGDAGSAPTAEARPAAQTVSVAPVQMRPVERVVRGDGSVVAWQELVVGSEAGGLRVLEVAVEEGDTVRAGQVLVRLDDAVPRAVLDGTEAAVAEAQSALELAGTDLRRAQQLLRGDFTARQTLEQRVANEAAARARLASARARRDEAAARLAQVRVLAPAAGVVSRRAVLPGTVVSPGQEMLRLIRDGRVELDARVSELDLSRVVPGQAARVTHGERTVEATVRAVAPTVSADTRLGIVHLSVPAGSGLRPGMFARAAIVAGSVEAPVVAREALLHRDGRPVAFALDAGDRAELRRLELGEVTAEGKVEIREGLGVGERVVTAGAGFLNDGDRVRVAEAAR